VVGLADNARPCHARQTCRQAKLGDARQSRKERKGEARSDMAGRRADEMRPGQSSSRTTLEKGMSGKADSEARQVRRAKTRAGIAGAHAGGAWPGKAGRGS
jgi:hypothetical protein